jgi:hypothetical protein
MTNPVSLFSAWELILRPRLDAKAKLMSFNRTQSRAVIGLLIGHNTLRRHLHILGLSDSPLCRRCGVEEETSAHIPCECEALASLWHVHLGSFLESEDIKSISLGAIWNFSKARGLTWNRLGAQRANWKRLRCIGCREVPYPRAIYLSSHLSRYCIHDIIFCLHSV